MPRDNPRGDIVQEIAILSEEIDRREGYMKDPQSLQAWVQELTARRAELLAKFREVSNAKPPPHEQPRRRRDNEPALLSRSNGPMRPDEK
jgi:hypothetical protein